MNKIRYAPPEEWAHIETERDALRAENERMRKALEVILSTSGKEVQTFDDFNIIRYHSREALKGGDK